MAKLKPFKLSTSNSIPFFTPATYNTTFNINDNPNIVVSNKYIETKKHTLRFSIKVKKDEAHNNNGNYLHVYSTKLDRLNKRKENRFVPNVPHTNITPFSRIVVKTDDAVGNHHLTARLFENLVFSEPCEDMHSFFIDDEYRTIVFNGCHFLSSSTQIFTGSTAILFVNCTFENCNPFEMMVTSYPLQTEFCFLNCKLDTRFTWQSIAKLVPENIFGVVIVPTVNTTRRTVVGYKRLIGNKMVSYYLIGCQNNTREYLIDRINKRYKPNSLNNIVYHNTLNLIDSFFDLIGAKKLSASILDTAALANINAYQYRKFMNSFYTS